MRLRHLFIWAALSMWMSCAYGAGALSERLLNPSGGTTPADGIRVYLGSNSQVQVVGYSNITGAPGVYPQMYSGCTSPSCTGFGRPVSGSLFNTLYLRLGPIGGGSPRIVYGNSQMSLGGGYTQVNFVQTSQSPITGSGTNEDPYTVITVLSPPAPDDGITLTVTDSYIAPNSHFSRAIDVTGVPADEQAILYWHMDTYLAGGDNGRGTSQTSAGNTSGIPDFIGVTKPGVIQGIQAAAGTPLWNHYYSGQYSQPTSVYIVSPSGNLPDTVDTNLVDNGIAVQWTIPAGQTTFSVQTGQTYGGSALVAESYVPNQILVNEQSVLEITFRNFDTGDAVNSLTASYSLPAGVTFVNETVDNGCPGSDVTISGPLITMSNVSLPVATTTLLPFTCTLRFNVTSAAQGAYVSTLYSPDARLSSAASGLDTLVVNTSSGGGGGGGGGSAIGVPTLDQWGLILLIGLMLVSAGALYRRRHA